MTDYPLIIRNRIPLFYRGFMLVFVAGVAVGTYLAIRDAPADGGEWWSIPIAAFWLAGIGGLVWAMNQEIGVLRVAGRGDVHITRGRAFRRVEHRTGTVRLSIEDTKDSEGDPYFKLWIEAPGGPLASPKDHSGKASKHSGRKSKRQSRASLTRAATSSRRRSCRSGSRLRLRGRRQTS